MRTKETPTFRLLLPSHFTAISMWVECLRLLPSIPVEQRIRYANGMSFGFVSSAMIGGAVGFYLTGGVPAVLAAALLFITPLSFMISVLRNSREIFEKLAFVLGLVIGPVLAYQAVELDLMWTGIIGGLLAYGFDRLRRARTVA
jgi:hypothetical protein